MGNTCCRKPDEDILNTIESQDKDEVIKDKYPHDSDSAFRLLKQQQDKNPIAKLPTIENIIEEK